MLFVCGIAANWILIVARTPLLGIKQFHIIVCNSGVHELWYNRNSFLEKGSPFRKATL